ncbi:MAG: hypothetical protein HYV07_14785 [Deltaproteobacteria bacterium]|nr:hypothetical protein [Deltaproteobacteria bacterium]
MSHRSEKPRCVDPTRVTLAACTVGLFALACEGRNPDINTVQPGYVKKALFQSPDEWYYRRTIAKSEVTNSYAIEGQGDIWIDRIKWRVEENVLLAYRPHEGIPGTEMEEWEGASDVQGSVLAAWPIVSHFDIIRAYDPATGNTMNTIDENQSDRPWYQREFMRIDWASNLVEGDYAAGWGVFEFPISYISTGSRWASLDTEPTNPFSSRFEQDYIEVNDNVFVAMDIYSCAVMTGFTDGAWYDFPGAGCGFGEAELRHSFSRITKPSDFIPRDFPDSVVRTDKTTGKPIYDVDTGEVSREPIYNRFGIFRIETPTYDQGYGLTESGRNFRAMVFNIWEKQRDENGFEIPMKDRTPKPLIYYLNAEYPPRWREAARHVSDDYNEVWTKLVADVLETTPEGLTQRFGNGKTFRMYEIRDNDCNADHIREFVGDDADRQFAVRRAVCKAHEACDDPMSMIGLGNLEEVCTSLEAATRDPETGTPAFTWQRIGDVRTKMLIWLNSPQQSGWGGYGPMHADYRTGETIGSSAFIRGPAYETFVSTMVDWIELINDEKPVEDIIWGQDIRRHIQATQQKLVKMTSERASDSFALEMDKRFDRLGRTKQELLREVDPNWQTTRLARAKGTKVEAAMASAYGDGEAYQALLSLATNGRWHPSRPIPDDAKAKLTPEGRIGALNPFSPSMQRARRAFTNAGFCFLKHDFDPHWAGLALQLKGVSREQRFEIIGNMTLEHVFAHEIGHNFGLAHNFEGTYDALNYYDGFWALNGDGAGPAPDATTDEKTAGRMDEKRNTSVMEYLSAKGAFSNRLGRYDEAAFRFAYGNQVQVFTDASLKMGEDLDSDGRVSSFEMRAWREMNDYNKIATRVCGGSGCSSRDEIQQKIDARDWVTFDAQNPPANEVPYLFCDNYYDRVTPTCATFDYGSSLTEIHANYYSMWSDYFFFNNFSRDRLQPISWSIYSALYPTFYAMLNLGVVNQYMYYHRVLDPDFFETDLGKDMLTSVAGGLNMASEIMSTPEPIRMCPWPGTTNPQVFIPYYYLADCDERAAINSQYAVDAEAIQLPLGVARPATIGFTSDFVDYNLEFIGSFFDKANVLWLLGYYYPALFRYMYELDIRSYESGLYRLFEPELRDFYDRMMNLDPYRIEQETALDFGSYWCRDPQNPAMAYRGAYEPRRLFDPVSGKADPGPSAECENAGVLFPSLLRNMPFDAMFWAYALFTSPYDSELDMGKSLKVFVTGADDEFPEWRNLPDDQICSCVDELTGLDYRAIRQPAPVPDLGCRLIERACQAQNNYLQDESNDFQRERWRSWFERLEFARDLTRVFDR